MASAIRVVEPNKLWRFSVDSEIGTRTYYVLRQGEYFTLHNYCVRLNGPQEENTYGTFESIDEAVNSVSE